MAGKKGISGLSKQELDKLHSIRLTMETSYKKHETIPELARLAGMNETKFKESFKALFGLPPFQYFRSLRIAKAKDLLLNTDESVKSIGIEVGYPDWKSFMRAFKKSVGITPSSWRKKHVGKPKKD